MLANTASAIADLASALAAIAARVASGGDDTTRDWDLTDLLTEWATDQGLEYGPAIHLPAYRNAVIALKKALDRVVPALKEGIAEHAYRAEECPGCGCLPGDGLTDGCNHPNGCGEARLQEASAHDLTMAGI